MLLLLLVTASITLPPSEGVDMTVLDYREVTIYNAFYNSSSAFISPTLNMSAVVSRNISKVRWSCFIANYD
jgi:hypothetical protein